MKFTAWWILRLWGSLGKRMYVMPTQVVNVKDTFESQQRILDLGGGGEGVIGQLRGQQVVAVDLRQNELDEAPSGAVKTETRSIYRSRGLMHLPELVSAK